MASKNITGISHAAFRASSTENGSDNKFGALQAPATNHKFDLKRLPIFEIGSLSRFGALQQQLGIQNPQKMRFLHGLLLLLSPLTWLVLLLVLARLSSPMHGWTRLGFFQLGFFPGIGRACKL